MSDYNESLDHIVLTRLMRLNGAISGIVLGIILGGMIFIATNWLIIKGGPIGPEGEEIIGPHLWLLSQYFYGYGVTFGGSIIGFFYGLSLGFIIGYTFATLYNRLVTWKEAGLARVELEREEAIQKNIHEPKSSVS